MPIMRPVSLVDFSGYRYTHPDEHRPLEQSFGRLVWIVCMVLIKESWPHVCHYEIFRVPVLYLGAVSSS